MKEGIHYSSEFEAAVLGICLLEKTAFGRTVGLLDEKSFYYLDNQKIYEAMKQMFNQNLPIDLLTVWEFILDKKIQLHVAANGNHAVSLYLTNLSKNVVCSTHLEYHCHIIKKMWRKRELLAITTKGIDVTEDERKQIHQLNQQLNDILGSEVKQDWYSVDQLMFDLMVHQTEISSGKKQFVTTGFRSVNKENGGFSEGQLIILGARPGIGKSALMGKIAIDVARSSKTVGIVSLEMNNNEVAGRLASLETDIEFAKIYRNLFDDEKQQERFYNIVSRQTINLPLFVSDKAKVNVNDIRAKAMKLKYSHGLDMLIVDYLQLIDSTGENKNYNREQEVSKMSRGLKLLAMELKIPIMVLCQLNRAVTNRSEKNRYPQLQDLRESGAIEQDADVVMMLHRDYKSGYETNENGSSTEFEADLLCLKWRNGATFHLKLDFEPTKMKFKEQPTYTLIEPPKEQPREYEESESPF